MADTTFPLPTLAGQVTLSGFQSPSFQDILSSITAKWQEIYGSDIYIDPDSQDGQMIAFLATVVNDCNNMAMAVYNSFSPTFAQGVGLSSLVKINGLQRQVASKSSAVGNVVGVAGTTITNGVVQDENNNLWTLPASVLIPVSGSIAVTVTAQNDGAIQAPAGTINSIATPQLGWQSFVSTSDATAGNPIESDAALRQRQAASTMLPAQTPLDAITGQIAAVAGVEKSAVYENPDETTDGNGLPPHSICAVVQGGAVQDIINAIGANKTPGCATFGSTSGVYVDPVTQVHYTINYDVMTVSEIKAALSLTVGDGWSTETETLIKQSIVDYINSLKIGQMVQFSRLWAPAYLNGNVAGLTYEITEMTAALGAGTPGTVDIPIPFNSSAQATTDDVTITINT